MLSGDTVIIAAPSRGNAPPPEKRLSLSSLVTPKLGRRDGSTLDEPYAFASKEFLRRLAIGRECVFRVDYKIEAANRDFGSVFLGEDNLALKMVAAGMARVREGGSQQSPFYEQLLQAQEAAKNKRLGVHNDDPKAMAASIRDAGDEDAAALLKKLGKGAEVKAIVDSVISGSMVRVTLTASRKTQVVLVTGIQCPSMKTPGATQDGVSAPPSPEPFARESRYLCESLCLNRDVVLILDGLSQQGALIAQIRYPSGAPGASAESTADLAEALMSAGLAKGAEWSLNMMTSGAFALREAERAARAARKGQWHDLVANPSNVQNQKQFQGKVVEVISGDCLIIAEDGTGAEKRVTLSSIRTPRPASRDRVGEPYGAEAKEFLRSRLIGKTVRVEMEYSKKIPVQGVQSVPSKEATQERTVDFGSVFVGGHGANGANGTANSAANSTAKGAAGEANNAANVAEMLLIRGLATTVKHRADDERSAYFERLFAAEENGKSSKKGIHSGKEAPVTRVNDLSAPGSAAKARQHLPFLQRAGAVSAVVEFVMSGSRLKLYVPKQSVAIAFSPSGVQCPRKGDDFSDEALAFTRKRFMQRSVELHIEGVDKLGTFLGSITVGDATHKTDLSVALLEAGLGKIHGMSNASAEMQRAEDNARSAKRGVWSKEPKEEPKPESVQFNREKTRVVITEMCDANAFYVQSADDARAQWVADQIKELTPELEAPPGSAGSSSMGTLRVGMQVLAKFAPDKCWYVFLDSVLLDLVESRRSTTGCFPSRTLFSLSLSPHSYSLALHARSFARYRAKVTRANTRDPLNAKYDVQFIDFGNRDTGLTPKDVRPMPQALAVVPAQAHLATLAFVRAPIELRDDLNYMVMGRISELTNGGTAVLEGYKEAMTRAEDGSTMLHLTLFPGQASEAVDESINGELAMDGLVKCAKQTPIDPESRQVHDDLCRLEREARRAHLGIFEYGDVDDDDE